MKLDLTLRQQYQFLRKLKKLKLKELSVIVGVSVPMLSMYENGITNLERNKEQKYRFYIIQAKDKGRRNLNE